MKAWISFWAFDCNVRLSRPQHSILQLCKSYSAHGFVKQLVCGSCNLHRQALSLMLGVEIKKRKQSLRGVFGYMLRFLQLLCYSSPPVQTQA